MKKLDIHSVRKARKCITEIDEQSLHARYLLSQLIYDNGSISNINFSKLDWESINKQYSEWVSNYDVTEFQFNSIKEFLIKKTT
tara:strand:- start:103 stop:354 length:252 start_codon:yes stop_codon:yes gene_type:complete